MNWLTSHTTSYKWRELNNCVGGTMATTCTNTQGATKVQLLETLRAVSPYSPREKNIEFESAAVDYIDVLIAAQPLIEQKQKKRRNQKES